MGTLANSQPPHHEGWPSPSPKLLEEEVFVGVVSTYPRDLLKRQVAVCPEAPGPGSGCERRPQGAFIQAETRDRAGSPVSPAKKSWVCRGVPRLESPSTLYKGSSARPDLLTS